MNGILGIDVGFGNVKIFDGEREYGFPSVYAVTDEGAEADSNAETIHFLLDGVKYYIGKKAVVTNGNSQFDQFDLLRHKLFTLVGVCVATGGKDFTGTIGLGLPRADLKAMSDKLKSLAGKYSVEFNGKPVQINIEDVQVNVQGECVFDEIRQFEDVDGLNIGIIDIGQKTTDVSLFIDGMKVDNKSRSFDVGASQALTAIAEEYRSLTGYDVENYAVPARIKKGKISKELADKHYEQTADKILSLLSGLRWFSEELDKVYLIGGGCAFLQPYLTAKMPTCELHECYLFANARAYQLGRGRC